MGPIIHQCNLLLFLLSVPPCCLGTLGICINHTILVHQYFLVMQTSTRLTEGEFWSLSQSFIFWCLRIIVPRSFALLVQELSTCLLKIYFILLSMSLAECRSLHFECVCWIMITKALPHWISHFTIDRNTLITASIHPTSEGTVEMVIIISRCRYILIILLESWCLWHGLGLGSTHLNPWTEGLLLTSFLSGWGFNVLCVWNIGMWSTGLVLYHRFDSIKSFIFPNSSSWWFIFGWIITVLPSICPGCWLSLNLTFLWLWKCLSRCFRHWKDGCTSLRRIIRNLLPHIAWVTVESRF